MVKHVEKLSVQSRKNVGGRKTNIGAAREQRGTYSVPDDLAYEELVCNARRKLETRRASAMLCKVATPANPNSSWWRPCASDWYKLATKRLHSSCSMQDPETKSLNRKEFELRTDVTFPCRTTTWCTNRFPILKAVEIPTTKVA